MNTRYVVKPKADRDLDDYADYLSKEVSLNVALRFFDAAYRTFALLASQPNMGWRSRVKYPGLETLRVFRVSGFTDRLILYRTLPNGVDILRVVDGSRDLRSLLRREGLE